MAQTRKTFFDLGQAERIADPREEEAARRRALEIEEARRQDALRAAIEGEGIQRQQLAQSQQQSMAKLGFDREKFGQEMGLDRDRMAAAQGEAEAGRAHGLTLREMIEGGMDSRQASQFEQQGSMQESLFGHQAGLADKRQTFDAGESALDRILRGDIASGQQAGETARQGQRFTHSEGMQDRRDDLASALADRADSRSKSEADRADARAATQETNRAAAAKRRRMAESADKELDRAERGERLDYKREQDEKLSGERKSEATAARNEAALAKVNDIIDPENGRLTDDEMLRKLRFAAESDPNVRRLMQTPEFVSMINARMDRDMEEDKTGFGAYLGRVARRLPNIVETESVEHKQDRQRDALREALNGPRPEQPSRLGQFGWR